MIVRRAEAVPRRIRSARSSRRSVSVCRPKGDRPRPRRAARLPARNGWGNQSGHRLAGPQTLSQRVDPSAGDQRPAPNGLSSHPQRHPAPPQSPQTSSHGRASARRRSTPDALPSTTCSSRYAGSGSTSLPYPRRPSGSRGGSLGGWAAAALGPGTATLLLGGETVRSVGRSHPPTAGAEAAAIPTMGRQREASSRLASRAF